MTQPTAIIAEDEAPQRTAFVALLHELWPELQIAAECADGLAALEAIAEHKPAIAFLDIRMPGISGLEVARAADPATHIVFTTAYDQYAVRAFDEGAIDYLLKPVTRDRLDQTLKRLKARLQSGAAPDVSALLNALQDRLAASPGRGTLKWITAGQGDAIKMFAIDDVLFFQAQDKYTRVVTAGDEALIRTPLKDLLAGLDSDAFWQVHRSCIVRANAIAQVKRDELGKLSLTVKGRSEPLPVSSAFQHRFKVM
jgi:DNA-binding LytR/AlgR family response regulator